MIDTISSQEMFNNKMGLSESRELMPEVKTLRLSGAQVSHLRERFELISDSFGLER